MMSTYVNFDWGSELSSDQCNKGLEVGWINVDPLLIDPPY